MIAPDLEALIAEAEDEYAGIPKPMLQAFLRIYHTRYPHQAWFTIPALHGLCTEAAVDSIEDTPRFELTTRVNRLWVLLANRHQQEYPNIGPPYSTEIICGYVQEMLDARP